MTIIETPSAPPAEPDPAPTVTAVTAPARVAPRPRRTGPTLLVGVATLALIAVLVATQHKLVGDSFSVFGQLRLGWIAAAVVAEVISVLALARMHRRLVLVGGVGISNRSALALAYASNAISGSVPVAGSEVGTAYTFRQYQQRGVKKLIAAWVLTIAGVVSSLTFALIVALSAVASGNRVATIAGLAGTAGLLGGVTVLLLALRSPRLRQRLTRHAASILLVVRRIIRRPGGDAEAAVNAALQQLTALHLQRRGWTRVIFGASLNWIADILCLVLAIKAIGQPVPWALIIPAWAAGATASSFSLTPGGLGVVEAALAAALATAGLHSTAALGAVLAYRAVTFWLALGIGWTIYLLQQHHDRDKDGSTRIPARDSPPLRSAVSHPVRPDSPGRHGDPLERTRPHRRRPERRRGRCRRAGYELR